MPILSLIQSNTSYALGAQFTPLITDGDGNALSQIGVLGYDGVGMAPLHRLSERGPQQHGITDRGYRLDPRTISVVFGVLGNSLGDLQDALDLLLTYLVPTDTALALRLDRENGTARQIDCHVAGPPLFGTKDRKGFYQVVGINFLAPDPLWYDPTQVAETFGASGASTGMAIPWKIPWQVGASNIAQSRSLTYDGTFKTFPVVQIVGPITSPVMTNTATGDKLDFTGTTIAGGVTYTIDCQAKTVTDSSGVNQISKLTTDSDLATFALLPHPVAPGGVNTITVSGTGISSATNMYLTYYVRYLGTN